MYQHRKIIRTVTIAAIILTFYDFWKSYFSIARGIPSTSAIKTETAIDPT